MGIYTGLLSLMSFVSSGAYTLSSGVSSWQIESGLLSQRGDG